MGGAEGSPDSVDRRRRLLFRLIRDETDVVSTPPTDPFDDLGILKLALDARLLRFLAAETLLDLSDIV